MNKQAELLALAKLRQATRWPGYSCIGDYHEGRYECDHVSPYTKYAGNVDAKILVMLQDWASEDWANGRFDEPSANEGYGGPTWATNRNLMRLLRATFDLDLREVYGTNLFPFVKPGSMSASIPQQDLERAAREFALPQIRIVNPKLVVCLGLVTFNALRHACGLRAIHPMASAIESPFSIGKTRVWCQAHTGSLGQKNRRKGGVDLVSQDWLNMKADFFGNSTGGSSVRKEGVAVAAASLPGQSVVLVEVRDGRPSRREKRMPTVIKRRQTSESLEYDCDKDLGNSFYVAGAPWGSSGARGSIGLKAAFRGYYDTHNFFFLNWLIRHPRTGKHISEWPRQILFQVGSPSYAVDVKLNDLRIEVINGFESVRLPRMLAARGYRCELGTRTSHTCIRTFRSTTLFTVVLDESHIIDTSEEKATANTRSIHNEVREQVEETLDQLQLAKRLKKHFGW